MSKRQSHHHGYSYEAMMRYARILDYGNLYFKFDSSTNLKAIIAIHSTELGPALGGVRLMPYRSQGTALKDALRLAYVMTLKSAFSDIPHGGAKSVIMKPPEIKKREDFFYGFGDFIQSLNGQYIAAMDLGTTTADMDLIAKRTPFVIGASKMHRQERDPSPSTALGVLRGIQAAIKFKLNRDNLEGIHVAIQGAGHVGYHLAKLLKTENAIISMSDVNTQALSKCVEEFAVRPVSSQEIYDLPCDIFSPCAIGGTINGETCHRIKAPIIAGSANNQLAHRQIGQLLYKNHILYAPDFVINAGGLISAAIDYAYHDPERALKKINTIYDNMLGLFIRAARENQPTELVAEKIAWEKIQQFSLTKKGGNNV